MHAHILIVDDEEDIRFSLRGILEDEGHDISESESGEDALDALDRKDIDLVLLDIWLTGIDGLAVLERIRERTPDLPVIMISGHGNIETAVSAMNKGASDFIEKPLSLEKVILSVNKALELYQVRRENLALKTRIETDQTHELTGASVAIKDLKAHIARVAPTDTWVLITGENGTGKEIVARSIHAQSVRRDMPLVAVNCAAIPEELIESELFGHVKGAFTGAESSQAGKFELAHKGTLFLDEIGDMSLKTQAKILRILQEQKFERVGGRKTITVDVRVIAATNKDLRQEIRNGSFREDLFYRLNVFPLEVPPLRERGGDVPMLMEEFMLRLERDRGTKAASFTPAALNALMRYSWPGNVRELKNFVERMMIMYPGTEVDADRLPAEYAGGVGGAGEAASGEVPTGAVDLKEAKAVLEARIIEAKLAEFGGNVSRVAEALGLERSSLYRKMKACGIQAGD